MAPQQTIPFAKMDQILVSNKYYCDSTKRFIWSKNDSIEDQVLAMYEQVQKKNPSEVEYWQAVLEVLTNVTPVFKMNSAYLGVMQQILEPERVVMFRVPWIDDQGVQHVNRGFRVQYSSALGPYKGGLRFHPTVNLSVMKFLAFEQIFKNALTNLGIGGGKGGSDFDPNGRSDNEIMRFCQSFMSCLKEYIGSSVDVPAGDINVGRREIGYLYGQYKRLTHACDGTLTGKPVEYGGSHIRPEATGYGCVYYLMNWAEDNNVKIKDQVCVVSGSGNVAQYAAEKLIQTGLKVVTLSDSSGYVYEQEGFTNEQLQHIMHIKNVLRERISKYCKFSATAQFFPNTKPWVVEKYAFAFPCATQNEIDHKDAELIAKAGCKAVVEGANMPVTSGAVDILKSMNIVVCPAKAANAGGVAVSALEMAQNASRATWTREEVDTKLKLIMKDIYNACASAAKQFGCQNNLRAGADIAGFLRVADAVMEQGCV